MDRKAALGAVLAIPFLAVVCWYLTRTMTPIWGYFATLAVYWSTVLIPLMIWRGTSLRQWRLGRTRPSLIAIAALPVLIIGCVAAIALSLNPVPFGIAAAVVAVAIFNGSLEELFWRGTVQQDGATFTQMGLGVAAFTCWHFALLAAQGVTVTGGALALLGGAFGLGLIWAYLRDKTGTAGLGALSHIGINSAAFLELTSHNLV